MSYLQKHHHNDTTNDYLEDTISQFDPNTEKVGIWYDTIDSFLKKSMENENNIDLVLRKRKSEINDEYDFMKSLKKKGLKLDAKKMLMLKSLPNQFKAATEGSGIIDYVKSKVKKGFHNVKNIGSLLLIKHWKDLFNIMVKIARGESITSDDVEFIRAMVEKGLVSTANKYFQKFSSYFGDKVVQKMRDIVMSSNNAGGMIKTNYPSKNRLRYPSKNKKKIKIYY